MRKSSGRFRHYGFPSQAASRRTPHRRIPWIWVGLGLWLMWVGLISDHSFYRLWRLGRAEARTQRDLEQTQRQIELLESQLRDPATVRGLAEHVLREKNGMARPEEIIYRIQPSPDTLRGD